MSVLIYESIDHADEGFGPTCPKASADSGGYHWWYIDQEAEEALSMSQIEDEGIDYVNCVCKTCGQKMKLSADADEFPV